MSDARHEDAGIGGCALTILHAPRRRLAKFIDTDGSIIGYDDARTFDALEIVVRNLDHLAAILQSLLPCWDRCAVRGSLINGSPAIGIRRLLHPDAETGDPPTLYEVPRRYIAIDVEGIKRPAGIPATDVAACALAAIQHLPVEFHGRRCIAVATGSHGLRPDSRLRLWYWLAGAADRYRDAALAGIKDELLRATENHRHNTLVAAATRMFEIGSLSDAYVDRVIREAAVMLNGRGTRQIDVEEVDELLDWARLRASSGRTAA